MQLNHDCVRECLLYLENNLGVYRGIDVDNVISELLALYNENEIIYALVKLREAKYINGGIEIKHDFQGSPLTSKSDIYEITWEGHQYLDTVRDDSVWSKVKEKTSSLKSVPLSIAAAVGADIIKKKLGL